MLTYKAGQRVGRGTYWDLASGQRVDVPEEAVLDGGAAASYIRMSPGAMLASGPVIGLFYSILMPFIGIASIVTLATGRFVAAVYNIAVKSVSFGWKPGSAYLSGKKKKKNKK